MFILFSLLISLVSFGETLEVFDLEFEVPKTSVSCNILRHRALERDKILRELKFLSGGNIHLANQLISNKFFMDKKVWVDEEVKISFKVIPSRALLEQIRIHGFDKTFFEINGPGIVWQSFAFQTPEDYILKFNPDTHLIEVSYKTYQNEFCSKEFGTIHFDWIPLEQADLAHNTYEEILVALIENP